MRISRLFIFVFVLRLPADTVTSPLEFGVPVTVPIKFMLRTRTCTPGLKSSIDEALRAFGAFCFTASFSWRLFILSRTALRCFSSSLTLIPCLFIVFIVSSAYSFASRRISAASSFALRIILSVRSSSRFDLAASSAFSLRISSLYSFISACSFSIVILLFSRSESRSSKCMSLASMRFAASSIIYDGRPSFLEIANALLFPGTPISSL